MIFPIGDDNTGRLATPVVTLGLIAANVLVFVFLQGFGTNDRFTYAFSTVPGEILTGRDIVTDDRTVEDPLSGQTFRAPRSATNTGFRISHSIDVNVHAWRPGPPFWKHALPMDLRR